MELFSGLLAFLAFLMVCITGLIRGVPFTDVLMRGILALLAFALLGKCFGYVARRIVMENLPKMEDLGHRDVDGELSLSAGGEAEDETGGESDAK